MRVFLAVARVNRPNKPHYVPIRNPERYHRLLAAEPRIRHGDIYRIVLDDSRSFDAIMGTAVRPIQGVVIFPCVQYTGAYLKSTQEGHDKLKRFMHYLKPTLSLKNW